MKGCLKSPACSTGTGPSNTGSSTPQTRKCKCVAFCAEGSEEVHLADVWDRTPAEPARQLSYQDLLELKEIQCSLPRANQQADPISGRPASQFLSGVPIGLLPLLPETQTTPAAPPQRLQWTPPSLSRAPPPTTRLKPRFSFLPLLDSPSPSPSTPDSPSEYDPPTPALTNASLDSSPQSRASPSPSPSPEPLPLTTTKLHFGPSELDFVSPVPSVYYNSDTPSPRSRWTKWTPPPTPMPREEDRPMEILGRAKPIQRRKRNIIVVNGVEIPIDGDDDDEGGRSPVRVATPTMPMAALAATKPVAALASSTSPIRPALSSSPTNTNSRLSSPPTSKPVPLPSSSPPAMRSPRPPFSPLTAPHLPPPVKPPSPSLSPARTPSPHLTRTPSPHLTRTSTPTPPLSPSTSTSCGRQSQQGYMPISFKRDVQRQRGGAVV